MKKNLPARPNLEHLKSQAKALLAAIEARDNKAAVTLLKHLPAAKDMSASQVFGAHFRLADAQSAIARKSGFGSWPHLARYVDQLRSMEGTWTFARLEVDGKTIPTGMLGTSRILIDGDRFRSESPGAIYEGIFNINAESQPHEIDIEFVQGPEAGNWNYGIFRLDGDQLEICLDMKGKPRPSEFKAAAGSGHAYETLQRADRSRPQDVTGGIPTEKAPAPAAQDSAEFEFVPSPALEELQGQWTAIQIVRDGMQLPAMMLRSALRSAIKNEVTISFGGQTMIHALVKIDETKDPIHVDYYNIDDACKGNIQMGIMKWIDGDACFCMAATGQPRPTDFASQPGSERTLSQWRLKKK